MVARSQIALDDVVERIGDGRGEDNIFKFVKVKQPAQLLSGFNDDILSGIGLLIAAAVDVGADVFDKVADRLPHAGSLWVGGASVIEINPFHSDSPFSLLFLCQRIDFYLHYSIFLFGFYHY